MLLSIRIWLTSVRIILVIVSMHPQVAGRKIKTFTGTTVTSNRGQKQGQRRLGKLKRWKQMLWQSHCTLLFEHILVFVFKYLTRGFEPSPTSHGAATGANAAPVASSSNPSSKVDKPKEDKEERQRKKDERKQEKRARKELKKLSKSGENGLTNLKDLPRRDPSRSRSPRVRSTERKPSDERRHRTRSHSRTCPTKYDMGSDYDSFERERERENDRRRWDLNNARRNPPPNGRRF